MDEGTIGGSADDVLHDLQLVEEEAGLVGLQLNCKKTELICDDPSVCSFMLSAASELKVVSRNQATLLGTPLGDTELIDITISMKVDKLKLMGERLSCLSSQDALLLLHHSFAIPNLLYLLRTAPCFLSKQLEVFDDMLWSTLSKVLNVDLDLDRVWLQASLPVCSGGLGVRRSTQLAPSAYLASAAGCSTLLQQIVRPPALICHNANVDSALRIWSSGHSQPPPSLPDSIRQHNWDAPHIEATFSALLDQASDDQATSRLLAVSCSESGAWINTLPIAALGLRLSDEVVRVAASLRLGAPLCSPHKCSGCGADVCVYGVHGLSCRFSKGRHLRHSSLNDII